MSNLTNLEAALLTEIALCEMNSSNGAEPDQASDVHTYLWADERASNLGISEQAVGGVLTSLQTKGLIGVIAPNCKPNANDRDGRRIGDRDPDGAVWFTDAGFAAYKAIKPVDPEVVNNESRKIQVNICFNKKDTVTLYCRGKKLQKFASLENAEAYLTGWFGTADKTLWNTKNEFK